MNKSFPLGSKFKNLSEVKAAVSAAYQACRDESFKEIRDGHLYSRGKFFRSIKGDQTVGGEADSWIWDGTLSSLIEAIDTARFLDKSDELYIEGGLDWALNPAAKADGDYDPLVNDWSVLVWEKPA